MEEIVLEGDVLVEESVVLKGAVFTIKMVPGSSEGIGGWRGSFEMPSEVDATALEAFSKAQELVVKLEDGRVGHFIALDPMPEVNQTVSVQGSGKLE